VIALIQLVSRVVDCYAIPGDGFKNLIGGLGPHVWAGIVVPGVDPGTDVFVERRNRAVRGASELFGGELNGTIAGTLGIYVGRETAHSGGCFLEPGMLRLINRAGQVRHAQVDKSGRFAVILPSVTIAWAVRSRHQSFTGRWELAIRSTRPQPADA
jgi:hypothetical protein